MPTDYRSYKEHKLLVANRGEIATRIIRTAKALGLPTVAIYTPSDALSAHVSLADEAIPLPTNLNSGGPSGEAEFTAYTSAQTIISICLDHSVTLIHPGYGFLSENAEFASLAVDAGITFLGPRPEIIKMMGLKHEARAVAVKAGVPIAPGSTGLVGSVEDAIELAKSIGYPVMLKATAGGGGMGMVVCEDEGSLRAQFTATQSRSKSLFGTDGVIVERYFPAARHVEIQVFGNGTGGVVHMAERECSIQRRHQKVVEESPSPFVQSHPGLREKICVAAVEICRLISYNSAGTAEFLVDDTTGDFYFLEMNTRIQVEHPVTEAIHPGLDLVKLMIDQGIAERSAGGLLAEDPEVQQGTYDALKQEKNIHSIEGRVYAENPSQAFLPTPGLLQLVELEGHNLDWLRVDTWVSTGVVITPYFDGLLAKIIVTGDSREQAVSRFIQALDVVKIYGPPNNLEFLGAIATNDVFQSGGATTSFLSDLIFQPRALTVTSPGLEATVQDLPGRTTGLGIPIGGAMDSLALSAGNILVGNPSTMEGLEIIILPSISFEAEFSTAAVIAVTGKDVKVAVNGELVPTWSRLTIPQGGKLRLEVDPEVDASHPGFRVYLCVRGGFPSVPLYLGSKSTSMGLGGYQGRPLVSSDQLALGDCHPQSSDQIATHTLHKSLIPRYTSDWNIYVLPGPQDDQGFIDSSGLDMFYATKWRVSLSSNRLGIRLESPEKIKWARTDGGQGGSHPSNILDNGYAPGTININGDTPVIFGNDGPDMGGYVSVCTVASAERWKLGQLKPGDTIQFRRITWSQSMKLRDSVDQWIARLANPHLSNASQSTAPWDVELQDTSHGSILHEAGHGMLKVTVRQAGDSAILVDFGEMILDLELRARMHLFQNIVSKGKTVGLRLLCPCVRSIMCHYDPRQISQDDFLSLLVAAQGELPDSVENMEFTGRKISFPIVLDDPWNRDALDRYMKTTRDKAAYLPDNIEYIARNNGLKDAKEALKRLVGSDWLVLGVGFYLGCPFLVPIDPRSRLVAQKMNPSRTYTPRGAIGIAGPVTAIYPVESPGGYQLYGRTLPPWNTWGKGVDFSSSKPWLLQPFDQVHFEPISAPEYTELEREFDAGQYQFKIESTTFSVKEHRNFIASIVDEVSDFHNLQEKGSQAEIKREQQLLSEWEADKQAAEAEAEATATAAGHTDNIGDGITTTVTSSLFASVWKILSKPGDVIGSPADILLILEAMKTEIPVRAGEKHVGSVVKGFGNGVAEGKSVRAGDVLVVLGEAAPA